jgi:hypothetical protein
LLAYAGAVEGLREQITEAAQEFWKIALAYRDGELTLDEFRSEFSEFAPQVGGLMREVDNLSPPPQAEGIHNRLVNGLAGCDEAIGLMDRWFNEPSSDTQEAAALLVARCVEEVSAASDELTELVGQ